MVEATVAGQAEWRFWAPPRDAGRPEGRCVCCWQKQPSLALCLFHCLLRCAVFCLKLILLCLFLTHPLSLFAFVPTPQFSLRSSCYSHIPVLLNFSWFGFFWGGGRLGVEGFTVQHGGIFIARPRIEPMPSTVEVWSPNQCTTREFPV